MSVETPSHDALSAMPGDEIYFRYEQGVATGIVKTAGWQPKPNGGKSWVYETDDGTLVDNTQITKVNRSINVSPKNLESIASSSSYGEKTYLSALDALHISNMLKTASHCIYMGDIENLQVAQFLIGQRIKQLKELTPNNGI